MQVTAFTWVVAMAGIVIIGFLFIAQLIAILKPREQWTIDNVYGGTPDATAYFAFNQGFAWADVFYWAPLQLCGCIGMLLGQRWGFLIVLAASVPYWYSAIPIYVWDRDLGFAQNTFFYWVVVWGMFPAYGVIAGIYCFVRLL